MITAAAPLRRSEEHTSELQSRRDLVCRLLLEKKKKLLGYQVATNATIYKETDMQEIEQMFDYLSDLGVDCHTITPGYDYDAFFFFNDTATTEIYTLSLHDALPI